MEAQSQSQDMELKKAENIYNGLQEDIQKMLVEDYIKPQLEEEGNRLISLFNELIESEECSRLKYKCLIEPVTKIIENKTALEKMRKINTAEFDSYYIQHFIKKQNTFRQAIDPYESMCAALVMQRWH